jgi:glycosidase
VAVTITNEFFASLAALKLRVEMKRITPVILALVCFIGFQCKQVSKQAPQEKQIATVPATDDVVMYEVFVRNFTSEGTFNAMIPQLDRLKKLGVNVLWLMPIQPTGVENKKGTYGSPYAVQNYTEVNPSYGTKADFKRLVDSVHAKGMYIIIDEVANHTAWDCPWVKEHPDWYTHDNTGKITVPAGTDWTDVADLNYDNPDLRAAKIATLKYWIDSFNIDGYRCDVAEWVGYDWWKACIDTLRRIRPVMMLAEGADPKLYDSGFDMTYGWSMYSALKKLWSGKGTTATVDSAYKEELQKYPPTYHHIRFITNHDENSWDDVPQVKFGNLDGSKAAFIASMTLPGVPLLYNGQEVAYPTRINLFEKYTIDWSANPGLQQWYSHVLAVHTANDPLKRGTLDEFSTENPGVLIYQRKTLGKDPLWVIINAKNEEVMAKLPAALQYKKLTDLLSAEGISTEAQFKLRPYEYHIVSVSQ